MQHHNSGTAFEGVDLGERWVYDGFFKAWRCGDAAILNGGPDPAEFRVVDLSRDREVLLSERLWPAGFYEDDLDRLGAVLADRSGGGTVPTEGLGPWVAERQAEIDERADELERERADRRIGRTAAELLAETPETPDWVVPGLVAKGWAIKVAGREKGGKGTLIFYLLSRLERGEDTVFGPTAQPVSSAILTEEPQESVREKVSNFGLGRSLVVYGYELSLMEWGEKVDRLVGLAVDGGHGIVFVDNVSRSAKIDDENGTELARAVEMLQDACRRAGLTLIVDHHHKKGNDRLENKSRGGTALPGATDVNLEIEKSGAWDSRRRRLSSVGRLQATIWQRTFELNDDGTDYTEVDNATDGGGKSSNAQGLADLMQLPPAGQTVTVKEFAALVGVKTKDTARKRLRALVERGLAIEHEPEERGQPGTFERMPFLASEETP